MSARLGRTVASIEARMGSSRLPGKVLKPVCGKPALTRLLDRLRCCTTLDDIVLATSTAQADDALEDWAKREGVHCFRGSEDDVLGRVVGAQRSVGGEVVVEITGDCILTDPMIVDLGVQTFRANPCEIVSTDGSFPNWPMGQCVQVFLLEQLENVADTVSDAAVREHVSLYFYENPDRYRLIQLIAPRHWQAPQIRTQLDYPEDLEFIEAVHARLAPVYGDCFGIEPLIALMKSDPQLAKINRNCVEKSAR